MNILDIEMQPNDDGAKTIGEYLIALARNVWIEGEGFSGKRPFGNSGWQWEVYCALAEAGAIDGYRDKYGCWDISRGEERKAHELILKALS